MLLQSLVASSVESDPTFGSNHGKQDLLCDWNIPAKAWKDSSKCSILPHQKGSDLLFSGNFCQIPESNLPCKRRKLQGKCVIFKIKEVGSDESPSSAAAKSGPTNGLFEHGIQGGVQIPVISVEKSEQRLHENSVDCDFKSVTTASTVTDSKTAECANSESEVLVGDLSIRDVCISVLKSNGLLVGNWPTTSSITSTTKPLVNSSDGSIFLSCALCGDMDKMLSMLLCDNCEEPFHVSCCKLKTQMWPIDEWICQFCVKLNGKVSLGNYSFLKSHSTVWLNYILKFELGPIGVMLKYPEPYKSRVRIGKSFQADVPEWSNQIAKDFNCNGGLLEMEEAHTSGIHEVSVDKSPKVKYISNWLQCREVLHVGGRICGKWRRAPFSEVQTDFWDCSCSIPWDPTHSDCAVPQELETGEVLRHLKYLEQPMNDPAAGISCRLEEKLMGPMNDPAAAISCRLEKKLMGPDGDRKVRSWLEQFASWQSFTKVSHYRVD